MKQHARGLPCGRAAGAGARLKKRAVERQAEGPKPGTDGTQASNSGAPRGFVRRRSARWARHERQSKRPTRRGVKSWGGYAAHARAGKPGPGASGKSGGQEASPSRRNSGPIGSAGSGGVGVKTRQGAAHRQRQLGTGPACSLVLKLGGVVEGDERAAGGEKPRASQALAPTTACVELWGGQSPMMSWRRARCMPGAQQGEARRPPRVIARVRPWCGGASAMQGATLVAV